MESELPEVPEAMWWEDDGEEWIFEMESELAEAMDAQKDAFRAINACREFMHLIRQDMQQKFHSRPTGLSQEEHESNYETFSTISDEKKRNDERWMQHMFNEQWLKQRDEKKKLRQAVKRMKEIKMDLFENGITSVSRGMIG